MHRLSCRNILSAISLGMIANGALGCTEVNQLYEIQDAIQSSKHGVVLLCPFSVTRDEGLPLQILKEGTKLICAKSNVDDKCIIQGDAKHFDIIANGVTVLGFDFVGSKSGAVFIGGAVGTTFIGCSFTDNEKYVGNGGAIESTMNTGENIIVFGSTFEGNKASNGGAIYAGGISIISSTFNDNNANGTDGGAAYIGSGYVRNSMFMMNDAIGSGPAVFSSDHVCTMGLNHACHSYDHQENTCDGIVSTGGDCITFASSCEYPSSTPTFMPSLEPSLAPSVSSKPSQEPSSVPPSDEPSRFPSDEPSLLLSLEPSASPSANPSALPTSMPSSSPSVSPTMVPTKDPSSSPSSVPTHFPSMLPSGRPSLSMLPTNAPTYIPTVSQIPSLSPTAMSTSKPSTSMQPTVTCNMDAAQRVTTLTDVVTDAHSLDEGSLNSNVLQWLISADEYYVCPQADNAVQRYAAAVVLSKLVPDFVMPSGHECSWLGILCNVKSQIIGIKLTGLSAELPKELSLLKHLGDISIQRGSVEGTIPPNVFKIPNLKQVDLDKNVMSGTIEVHEKSSVQRLDINFNQFSGSIDFLTLFPNITEAHLDNNMFTGSIPESLGDLTNLHILALHGNSLSGTMPESICNLRKNHDLKYLIVDCDTTVECACCTHCNPYRK